jgi:hypothetical protein
MRQIKEALRLKFEAKLSWHSVNVWLASYLGVIDSI